MAVEILSPWPVGSSIAISVLKDAISPGASSIEIERLGAACSARIELYAPLAPAAIRTAALILFAGYLAEASRRGFGVLRSETTDLGDVKLVHDSITNHSAAFKNCGAAGILSSWKIRRGGTLKKAD